MGVKVKSFAVLLASAMLIGCMDAVAAENPKTMMETQSEVESETEQAAYELSFNGFQNAVKDGLAARVELGKTLKAEKISESEIQERYRAIAECEWEKLKDFEQAFPDAVESEWAKNADYVRKEYVEGVKKQKNAGKNGDTDSFAQAWQAGYEMRACALTELAVCYECQFDAVIKKNLLLTDETDESNDASLAKVIQAFAVAAGKLPNSPASLDGIVGDRTVAALKDMQAEKGILTSGIINRKRVKELKEAYPDLVENVNVLLSGSGLTVEEYLPREVAHSETTEE